MKLYRKNKILLWGAIVIVLVSFGVIAWFLIPSLHKLTTSQPLFNPWNRL
jgi:hypothetical protein